MPSTITFSDSDDGEMATGTFNGDFLHSGELEYWLLVRFFLAALHFPFSNVHFLTLALPHLRLQGLLRNV